MFTRKRYCGRRRDFAAIRSSPQFSGESRTCEWCPDTGDEWRAMNGLYVWPGRSDNSHEDDLKHVKEGEFQG